MLNKRDYEERIDDASALVKAEKTQIANIAAAFEESKRKARIKKIGLESPVDCSNEDAMLVIRYIERNLDDLFSSMSSNGSRESEMRTSLEKFFSVISNSIIPLAAEIRVDQLREEYFNRLKQYSNLEAIDEVEGHSFEYFCANLLKRNGFDNVEVTKESGDFGVDILATKDYIRYAIQCKRNAHELGLSPIQEVYAGKEYYQCHVAVVLTNSFYSTAAKELADKTRVILWDRDVLSKLMEN